MKKKILTLSLAVCLAATAIVGGTLAYFTDTDSEENVFTVGNVDIDLDEPKWKETGEKEAEDAYPGEPLAKDPTVKNIGANPCFVRVSVSNLDQFVDVYGANANIIYRTDYVDGELGEGWELHTDGYFYYTQPLAVNATTDALFDQIVMPTCLTNNATAKSIEVTAEAVQAQGAKAPNWAAVQGMTVEEIAAWFETCLSNN